MQKKQTDKQTNTWNQQSFSQTQYGFSEQHVTTKIVGFPFCHTMVNLRIVVQVRFDTEELSRFSLVCCDSSQKLVGTCPGREGKGRGKYINLHLQLFLSGNVEILVHVITTHSSSE